MSWLMLLGIIMPLLLKILDWLLTTKSMPTNPRVVERLSELKTHCRRICGECNRLGIKEQGENL